MNKLLYINLILLKSSLAFATVNCQLGIENIFNAANLQKKFNQNRTEDIAFYDAATAVMFPEISKNQYYSREMESKTVELRQAMALDRIAESIQSGKLDNSRLPDGLENLIKSRQSTITNIMSKKGQKFDRTQDNQTANAPFADHVQFILDHARNSWDQQFRNDLIGSLGLVSGSTVDYAAALRTLAGVARGFGTVDFIEPKIANDAIKTLQYRAGQDPFRLPTGVTAPNESIAVRMLIEPITSIDSFSPEGTHGNVNSVLLVTFGSGLKAVFKPAEGEKNYGAKHSNWIHYKNEANAFHIYQIIKSKLPGELAENTGVFVPASIEAAISHEGKHYGIGSLQAFMEGFETLKTIQERDYPYLNSLNAHPDMAVARMIKVILGDYDSFPHKGSTNGNLGNIMARHYGEKLEIALIDNGVGRVDGLQGTYYQVPEGPLPAHISEVWQKAVLSINTKELRDLYLQYRLLNPGGLDNMLGRINQFQERFK